MCLRNRCSSARPLLSKHKPRNIEETCRSINKAFARSENSQSLCNCVSSSQGNGLYRFGVCCPCATFSAISREKVYQHFLHSFSSRARLHCCFCDHSVPCLEFLRVATGVGRIVRKRPSDSHETVVIVNFHCTLPLRILFARFALKRIICRCMASYICSISTLWSCSVCSYRRNN